MIGTILKNRYKIMSQLGSGSFGVVYLAQDIDRPGNPQCIVKQLKPLANDPYTIQQATRLFNEEAKVLEILGKHDQIPTLLAYFTENNEFYLVQEYIAGKTLRQAIIDRNQNNQSWSENEIIEFLKSILEPLSYVHENNVIHRDLKPDNLIIRESDQKIVIIDFGAVKQILQTQFSNSQSYHSAPTVIPVNRTVAIGTEGYMPTEQLLGFPHLTSDVYAVGMIIIEIITGKLAKLIPLNQEGEVFWQDQSQIKISQKLAKILTGMVKIQQHQRYQNAKEVLQQFETKKPLNLKYLISILSILLSLILISGLIFINQKKVKFLTYQEQTHNLTIDYPENWEIQNNPNAFNQDFIKFISPLKNNNDSFQENVTLTIENLQNNPLSLEEYTNEIFTGIKNNLDPTVATPVNITFANKEGKKIIFETTENNINIKRMQVWTINNYQVYILTFSATSQEFNYYNKSVDQMIQTFKIE